MINTTALLLQVVTVSTELKLCDNSEQLAHFFHPNLSIHLPFPGQLLLEPILYQEVNTILSLPLHTLSPFPLPSLLPTILSLSPPGCKYASV